MKKYLKFLILLIAFVFTFNLSSCNDKDETIEESVDYNLYIGTYEITSAKLGDVDVLDMFESYTINLKEKRLYESIIKYTIDDEVIVEEGTYSISNDKITFKLPVDGGYTVETYDILNNQINMYGIINNVEMEIILKKVLEEKGTEFSPLIY